MIKNNEKIGLLLYLIGLGLEVGTIYEIIGIVQGNEWYIGTFCIRLLGIVIMFAKTSK